MAVTIPAKLRQALWPHQRSAIAAMARYIGAFRQGQPRAGLVHMPTGSGKTGIIACLARFIDKAGPVVILCPRVGLRDQLHRDVSARFFRNAGFDAAAIPRTVARVTDGNIHPGDLSQLVLVMTVQMMTSIRDAGRQLASDLASKSTLVLFDEGHYEPATTWSDAVRSIRCPRVVFTATPFRDDFKLFDVDPDHVFRYTFSEALADRYVRRVLFHERPPTRSPADFALAVVADYKKLFSNPAETAPDRPRAIVRCDSQEEIRQLQHSLRKLGRSAIGIHENFSDDPSIGEFHKVPDPAAVNATFWVHQFKLLEGIDDPRFQLLALFSELNNVRSLVQQIGRVIRNPRRLAGATAHVLDHSPSHRQQALWDSFRKYDDMIAAGDEAALELNSKSLVDALRAAVPGLLYVDGRFRIPVSVTELDLEALQLPLSANVFERSVSFSLAALRNEILSACVDADLFTHAPAIRANTAAVFYISAGNSKLLDIGYFAEPKLGVSLVHTHGKYVFVFESHDSLVTPVIKAKTVPLARLQRLFGDRDGTRLTQVNILNANLGADQVRARSTAAVRVDQLPPGFDEHSYVLNTATGYSVERRGSEDVRVRRYLGVGRGRISDLGGRLVSFDEWSEWATHIATMLEGTGVSLPVFGRWASETSAPANTEPRNILLDLGDVIDRYRTVAGDDMEGDQDLEIADLCVDVHDGRFEIIVNGQPIEVEVLFDDTRQKYELRSRELDRCLYSTDREHREGVVRYLNRTQSFRLIPSSPGYFYTLGRFCRPLIEFGPGYDDVKMGVLASIVSSTALARSMTEKGKQSKPGGAGWESGCLFDVIDSLGNGTDLAPFFAGTDILVCDDIGDESADFIAVQSATGARRQRVAFIHGKASVDGSVCSASSLQDVCGQAQKNLREVSLFADARRSRLDKWQQPWKGLPHTLGAVKKRIRRAPPGNVEAAIQRVVKNPAADREVWLMLGNLLSKAELETQLRRARPAGHAIQTAYLLMSTISNVASAGARLIVFCS